MYFAWREARTVAELRELIDAVAGSAVRRGLSNISQSTDPDEAAKNRHLAITGTYEIPIRR